MAYTSSIPEATDKPSQSQSQIKDNFGAISTVVAVNHVAFDDSSGGQGKHKFMQMPEQSSAPATAANEGGLYTAEGAVTTNTELVFRRESSGTEIEMTAFQAVSATNGWTMLPSGLLIKWGLSANFSQNDPASTFTWPTASSEPAFSVCYNVQLTPQFNNNTQGWTMLSRLVSFSATTISISHTFTNFPAQKYRSYIYAIGLPV